MIEVEIINQTTARPPISTEWCIRAVERALKFSGLAKKIGLRPVTLSVHFISNPQMRKLNRERRDKDKPTDVLSFPMLMWQDKGSEVIELGDIFLSPVYIKKAAKEEGVTYQAHAKMLTVHGLVHLLDYDHQTPAQHRQMSAVEKKVLRGLK